MKSLLPVIFLLTLLSLNSCGQEQVKEITEEEMQEELKNYQIPDEYKKDKVVIFNSTEEKVTYYLGLSEDKLTKVKINPKESKVSKGYSDDPIFKIYTSEDLFSKYILERGKDYKIYYSTHNKKWDLTEIIWVDR